MTSKEFYQHIIDEEKRVTSELKDLAKQWDTAQEIQGRIELRKPGIKRELTFIQQAKAHYEQLQQGDTESGTTTTPPPQPEVVPEVPKKKLFSKN